MSTGGLRGAPAAPGVGVGRAWAGGPGPRDQRERLERGRSAARAELEGAIARCSVAGPTGAVPLLRVHVLLTADPALVGPMHAGIEAGATAEEALDDAAARLGSAHLPGRGAPAEEATAVLRRIRACLPAAEPPPPPDGPVVLVGDPPAIAELLSLHGAGRLVGIAAPRGGVDSHIGLLARELGVPAVMGVGPGIWSLVAQDAPIRIDGTHGRIQTRPPPWAPLPRAAPRPTPPLPGFAVRAALSSPVAAGDARAAAAEGIGLLRTDALWGRSTRDLCAILTDLARGWTGGGLTVRTFDRPGPALPRGPALLHTHPAAVTSLLEAACRAQASGPVRVLVPFVVGPGPIAAWRAALTTAAARCGQPTPPFGVMLETPAAALLPSALLREVDFAVVGTGDLCSLLGGTPREDLGAPERLATRPALLHLLAGIAGVARDLRRPVEVAGPEARHPPLIQALQDLGYSGISVAPGDIAQAREALRAPRA